MNTDETKVFTKAIEEETSFHSVVCRIFNF
jgi:hypothetical protein